MSSHDRKTKQDGGGTQPIICHSANRGGYPGVYHWKTKR